MKKVLLLLCYLPFIVFSQLDKQSQELNEKLDNLLKLVEEGDIKAISDVSNFLDNKRSFTRKRGQNTNTTNLREVALSILYYYTDFKGLSVNDSLTSTKFKKFLYKNNSKIKYSGFLSKFTNVPISERNVEYRLRSFDEEKDELPSLKTIKSDILKLVDQGRYYSIIEKIEEAAKLRTNEAFEFLKECAAGRYWGKGKNDRETQIYSGICYSLRHFETIESAKLIVEILGDHNVYSIDECIIALSKITNIDLVIKNQSYENIAKEYKQLLASYATLEELIKFGYESVFNDEDFESDNIAEFYGAVLLNSSDYWWINYHALRDIFNSNDSLALRYVGSQLHQKVHIYNDHYGRSEFNIKKIMENKTGLKLEVKDEKGNWTSTYNDPTAKVNYLVYWYNNYKDYKWNPIKGQFENIKDKILEPDQLTRLFKKLYSKNDSIALHAYKQLTVHNAEEVKNKINQYNLSIFSGINRKLPSFAKKFMLQLVELTDYCKKNKIVFEPSEKLVKKINQLDQTKSFKEKYQLENKLVESLKNQDITALEYYTLIYDKANSSVSRILDKWYSINWNQIVDNKKELRFYLKKAALFDKLGIIGNVNKYVFKFIDSKPSTIQKIKDLIEIEEDEDIRENALKALNHRTNISVNETESKTMILLSDFLNDISEKSIESALLVKLYSEEDYKKIFDVLVNANKEEANKLITIITRNINVNMTPYLIQSLGVNTLIDSGVISRHDINMNYHSISYQVLVSDKMVACLEHIHDHTFPVPKDPKLEVDFVSSSRSSSSYFRNKHKTADKWIEFYENSTTNYQNWGRTFYLNKINNLKSKDSISIEDINKILESDYFDKKDKNNIFSSFSKIKPQNEISYLKLKDDSLGIKDLEYFKNITFNPKDIERIVSMFDGIPPKQIINFIKNSSESFTLIEKGKMYSGLMWNTKFKDWIKTKKINDEYKNEIIKALKAYQNILKKDSFNYPYVNKFIGILESKDKSVEEILKQIVLLKSEGEELTKTILKDANYKDLGVILKFYEKLPITDDEKIEYLSRDFGFCLLGDYDIKIINDFKSNYETMSELQLYEFYLDEIEIPYKKNGKLNFKNIYDILNFDIVDGFTGGKDYKRQIHVYSIIKLLELHFNTHFGEEKKFNDSLHNFIYGVSNKANSWMEFLRDKGYVNIPKYNVPSISTMDR
ncbi:hypothetical protein [Tenacibaculum jejuense]|uniref:Uncharacterized protein n=1 Tax=Tenacibaculum jejuense TaxID=584609 RepID=A0A238UBU1_9FLAO|nr:hypothetical protein [Tenacibaculum jejuense]SNR16562.1 Protein of unknown function precursor. Putative outer-membrane protein [Tenacibaculum jejuense]